MARVKYVGDPKEDFAGPSEIRNWGHDFKKGDFRDVPDHVLEVAKGHPHFVVDGSDDGEVVEEHVGPTVEEVRVELDNLGVKYPKKAGVETLLQILEDAKTGAVEEKDEE